MISDGGGAVVIAAPEVARNCRKRPVWILGSGEATKYPHSKPILLQVQLLSQDRGRLVKQVYLLGDRTLP